MYNIILLYIINPQTSLRRFSRFHFHARLLYYVLHTTSIRSVPTYLGICNIMAFVCVLYRLLHLPSPVHIRACVAKKINKYETFRHHRLQRCQPLIKVDNSLFDPRILSSVYYTRVRVFCSHMLYIVWYIYIYMGIRRLLCVHMII